MNHNYLPEQFKDPSKVIDGILDVVRRGDFTLGREVGQFEEAFASMCGVKHAIGVANGTDALTLAIRAQPRTGVEVITTPYSFYATTAAIVHNGYTPVFADVHFNFLIDPKKVEKLVTERTAGIVPVHWAGRACDMDALRDIAARHNLWIVEDCAHAPNAVYHGQKCGSFGEVNAFSLHPLKNVNVWGDGGVITTNSDEIATSLRRLRNHGMADRDTVLEWGFNSRLDTIQAVVASNVLSRLDDLTAKRRKNADYLNVSLANQKGIGLPIDSPNTAPNYYLYTFHADRRDELKEFLVANGVDAKVHYPTPLHLQPAAKSLGYKQGDFPVAEWCANTTLSIPVHEYLTEAQLRRMVTLIREFYDHG